ncbi:hypothetical protein IOZ78_002641 [Salmonella enterica]|uniref:Uncharacterized protein n=2 Tax=Salmonella enterica TaxID=28901 RepID=A0A612Z238_SALER|nr:hypothetical protein [Salmonella enterica]EDV1839810.1 hypothetical protein [Salmonella enterica subsp. enterica serovar Brazil]EBN7764031.1 hypothetical protein [Salmonella enterica]EBO9549435.1 hypothetical protein [Salmonella enterica]EBS7335924.1 hypothetical protein [Salmonella enterica]
MRISEEGWRLLTFWMFTAGGYLILFFIVICLAFLFQTPRRVLLWIAWPQITLVLLLWFAAGDETLFFPIGAGWILGLSLLLALLFSHRLRQPHHLWAGCHAVVLLLLLAHIGDILERHHRRDAYQAQQVAEETLLQKIDTTDDRAFLNHLMSQAMQSQNAGDWWTNRRIEHLAKRISPFDIADGTEKIWLVLAIDRLNRPAVGAFASWFIGDSVQAKQYRYQLLQNNPLLDLLNRIFNDSMADEQTFLQQQLFARDICTSLISVVPELLTDELYAQAVAFDSSNKLKPFSWQFEFDVFYHQKK